MNLTKFVKINVVKIVFLIIIINCIFVSYLMFIKPVISKSVNDNFIPFNMLYYQGDKTDEIINLIANDNDIMYERVVPYIEDKTDKNKIDLTTNIVTTNKIPFSILDVTNKNISSDLFNDLIEYKQNGIQTITPSITFNGTNKLSNDLNLRISPMDVDTVICGSFPDSSTSVMIPEIYALLLVTKYGGNYQDLIGTSITIELANNNFSEDYTISGIYYGATNFIVNPPKQIIEMYTQKYSNIKDALIIKFDSGLKKIKFLKSNDYNFYKTSDFLFDMIVNNDLFIIAIFMVVGYNLLLLRDYRKFINIANTYNKSIINISYATVACNMILLLDIIITIKIVSIV